MNGRNEALLLNYRGVSENMLKINDSMLRLIQTILFMLLIILSCSQLLDTGDFGSSYGIQAFDDISFAIFTGIVLYFLFVF